MTLFRDLISIPTSVHKGDFVLRLAEGVTQPDATLRDYVVTEQLAVAFGRALDLIRSALDGRTSKATYLHGSFGSGKSHFMAVLHLLLAGNLEARSVPALAPHIARHQAWLGGKKFLLVPYHMIGEPSMEAAILGGYVRHVLKAHPGTRPPAVYLADPILEDAQMLRGKLGDSKFFELLSDPEPGGGGWGQLEAGWDAASFEAALAAGPTAESKMRLLQDLVHHVLPAHRRIAAHADSALVSLDDGLAIVSRHAKELGYDAVILFLDELILWLASRIGDASFVSREGQKLVKLVEAAHADRPIPLISFVARQRDLRELVGQHIPGAQHLSFADTLKYWEGRFETITLEDRNLPAIAAQRILKPVNAGARGQIDDAFEKIIKLKDSVLDTLLTTQADRAMFRSVYPFSPAFVQALIAVSSALQRERTALKVMVQLLVNQRDRLALGEVVPVGDLFDVIAEGDEPFTEEMRLHFQSAKKLYQTKLVPLLENEHGVSASDVARAEPANKAAQGYRASDRLLKTLILAALVPEVEAFRNLTVSRLSALNHGVVRSPIQNQEASLVLQRLRKFAGHVGEIKIGDEQVNPTVSIQLTGVDTDRILANAQAIDTAGNRQAKVREMLFKALGIPPQTGIWQQHSWLWRGTMRSVDVLFGNVRDADRVPDASLVAEGDRWKVVIDFPFDEERHSPKDDEARLTTFIQAHGKKTRTVCWLPRFLSLDLQTDLGKLVKLDHILAGERYSGYATHLSAVEKATARTVLENQATQLKARLIAALEGAYGIATPAAGTLDLTHTLETQFVSLYMSFEAKPPVGANLSDAFTNLLDQMLSEQFPAHPMFEAAQEIKARDVRKVLDEVRRAVPEPQGRIEVDRATRPLMNEIARPLKLGETGERTFVVGHHWKDHFERKLAAEPGPLTVARLRAWTDEPRAMGLTRDLEDLVILAFAEQTGRGFVRGGVPVTPSLGELSDEIELKLQDLPPPKIWEAAVPHAAAFFGLASSGLLNASNVAKLAGELQESARSLRAAAGQLPGLLERWMPAVGLDPAATERHPMAVACQALLDRVASAAPGRVIEVVAEAPIVGSSSAMGTSIKSAGELTRLLGGARLSLFSALAEIGDERKAAADAIREELAEALSHSELAIPLAPAFEDAQDRAVQLLARARGAPEVPAPPAPPPKGGRVIDTARHTALEQDAALRALDTLRKTLEAHPDARLEIQWTLTQARSKT